MHAYVLGEHGDTQFPVWSSARIGSLPLSYFSEQLGDQQALDTMALKTKNKAYDIIHAKGATYFGIGAVVSSICECIFLDQKHIRPLSVYRPEFGVCISFPTVLGSQGVERVLPVELDDKEKGLLQKSVDSLKSIITQYEPKLKV